MAAKSKLDPQPEAAPSVEELDANKLSVVELTDDEKAHKRELARFAAEAAEYQKNQMSRDDYMDVFAAQAKQADAVILETLCRQHPRVKALVEEIALLRAELVKAAPSDDKK